MWRYCRDKTSYKTNYLLRAMGCRLIGRVKERAKPAETFGVAFQQAWHLVPLAEVHSVFFQNPLLECKQRTNTKRRARATAVSNLKASAVVCNLGYLPCLPKHLRKYAIQFQVLCSVATQGETSAATQTPLPLDDNQRCYLDVDVQTPCGN